MTSRTVRMLSLYESPVSSGDPQRDELTKGGLPKKINYKIFEKCQIFHKKLSKLSNFSKNRKISKNF